MAAQTLASGIAIVILIGALLFGGWLMFRRARSRRVEARAAESVVAAAVDPAQFGFACSRCSRTDASLRVSILLYVYSLLLVSFRRASVRVLCARCRGIVRWRYILTSGALGIWGIWGFLWTLQAIWTDIAGGTFPPEINARYLAALAATLYRSGDVEGAQSALAASLAFKDDPAVRALSWQMGGLGPIAPAQTRPARTLALRVAAVVVFVAILGAVALALTNGGTAGGSPTDDRSTGSKDLVFDGPPARFAADGTVTVSGTVRNTSTRPATSVWLEVIVKDGSTGREVARAKKPDSAPLSDVSVKAGDSIPFEVSVRLGANAPDRITVERAVHWKR